MELSLVSSASLLLLALSAAYVYYTTLRRSRSPPLRLPPAPPGWPVIGHLHLLSDMPHHAMAKLVRSMRAPLLRLRLGSVPAVVISKPELARSALTANDAALASRPHLLSVQFISFGCSDVTFAPAGAYHRMAHRVVVSELLSARQVSTYGSVRVKELRLLLARLAKNSTPDAPVDLSECFLNLANDVLCRVAFGRRFPHGGKDDKLAAVLAEAQDLFAGFTVGDYIPVLEPLASTVTGLRRRLTRCLADLREVCDEIVDEHVSGRRQRVAGEKREEDFVDVLRVQKSPDLEVPLTDDNLKALVLVPTLQHIPLFAPRRLLIKRGKDFSNQCYKDTMKLNIDLIPIKQNMLKDLYQSKKIVISLCMNYEKIDMCEKNSILFWKEHKDDIEYMHYGRFRYMKVVNEHKAFVTIKIVVKQLHYMPITLRFIRLYISEETQKQMRWHKEVKCDKEDLDIISYHVNSEAWEALAALIQNLQGTQ
jgi:hypothetical protein